MQSHYSSSRREWLKLAAGCGAALCAPLGRAAPAWPAKPVSLIVPFPAGGPIDAQMRALAHALSAQGPTVVVLNQPGASGTLGPSTMARAAPDGATLAVITTAVFRLPHLQKVSYDPLKDFSYIVGLTSYTYAVSVPVGSRWKSVAEVVAYAKDNPGKLNVAAVGTGSLGQIATDQWQKKAGMAVNYVPFKGGADAMTALLGGHVDVMFEAGWGAMAQAGKVRLLAVAEPRRLPGWPDVPTMAELGYDITVQSVIGIAGPRQMDAALVTSIQNVIQRATRDENYQRALAMESMPNRFLGARDYTDYAARQFAADRDNIRELGLVLQ